MRVVQAKATHMNDAISVSTSSLLPHQLVMHKRVQRDKDPEQWLINRSTTDVEYREYVKQSIETPDVESEYFFTRWSDELINKDVNSILKQMRVQMTIDENLRTIGGSYTGNFYLLTLDETIFILQALRTFRDIIEIYAVNELGYTDIWLVFPEAGVDILETIDKCRAIINRNGLQDISYMPLHPDNFIEDVPNPLLHITMGGS